MKLSLIIISLFFAATSFAKPEKVQLDLTKSVVKWKGGKEFTNDSHVGTVGIKTGYVEIEKGQIVSGEIVFDMNKIDNTDLTDASMKGKLIGHLQSEDFFDTQKHQTATYKIKKVINSSDKMMFDGDLTVRGKTHPLRVNTVVTKENKVYTAKGSADFDRTKYDVKYNSSTFMPNLVKTGKDKVIKNAIEIEFDIKTVGTDL